MQYLTAGAAWGGVGDGAAAAPRHLAGPQLYPSQPSIHLNPSQPSITVLICGRQHQPGAPTCSVLTSPPVLLAAGARMSWFLWLSTWVGWPAAPGSYLAVHDDGVEDVPGGVVGAGHLRLLEAIGRCVSGEGGEDQLTLGGQGQAGE